LWSSGATIEEELMTVDRSHEAANDAERARLRSLIGRLTDEDLTRPMPGGWTVAAQLAHAGFWDARASFALDKWARGIELVEKIRILGPFNVSRAEHRREHLDDFERALATKPETRS
jgi:hypothetical protein